MKTRKHSFLAGVLVALILCSVTTPVSAANQRTIDVWGGVSIYVDDVRLEPKDAGGNPVDVFIYNGTTYLPVRAISNVFDVPIQWEGDTWSVYLGKHKGDKPAVYIKDMQTFTGYAPDSFTSMEDNLGETHYNVVSDYFGKATYLLNGQYSAISGNLFQTYQYRSNTEHESYIEIYGDDKLLLRETITGGQMPKDFYVDLTGVLKLEIHIETHEVWYGYQHQYAGISDLGLWT